MPRKTVQEFVADILKDWEWLGFLRLLLGAAIIAEAVVPPLLPGTRPSHPILLVTGLLGLMVIALAIFQMRSRLRSSHRAAIAFAVMDAASVLAIVGLQGMAGRRDGIVLFLLVQAEGGVVMGLPGAFWYWLATGAAYTGIQAALAASAPATNPVDVSLRLIAGLLLSLGAGLVAGELRGERARSALAHERELRRIHAAGAGHRLLLEQMPAIAYVDALDPESSAMYMSPQVGSMLGYEPEEWLADPKLWIKLLHPDDREEVLAAHHHSNVSAERFSAEYRLMAKDGRVVWVSDHASLVPDETGGWRWHGLIVDITERKAAEQAKDRQAFYLEALRQAAVGAMRRMDPRELLELVVERAGVLVGTPHGYAYLKEPDGRHIEVKVGVGLFTSWIGYRMKIGQGLAGRLMASGEAVIIDDYDAWEGRSPTFPTGVFHAVMGVPLKAGDEVVGVFGFAHPDPEKQFTAEDVELMTRFAEIASVSIEHSHLYARLEEELLQRKEAQENLSFLAFHDDLTGLPNRTMFEEALTLALARAGRRGDAVAVLFMDIDNLKLVNDNLGHSMGDDLLKTVARRLRLAVRSEDLVARLGGDEFLALLADLPMTPRGSPKAIVETITARISEVLGRRLELGGSEIYPSASIGVSLFPTQASDAPSLLRLADRAMYVAKKRGGGTSNLAAAEAGVEPSLTLLSDLKRATEEQQWVLHYQPIVEIRGRRMVGVEALIRWRHPSGSLVAPSNFIPLAEEIGLIDRIGAWVIEEVFRQAGEWHRQGHSLTLSFNLSTHQLLDDDLASRIGAAALRHGVDPRTIVVEITESASMMEAGSMQRVLWELHRKGVQLAIDDFGSAYSSLSRLRGLPIDVLKIDRPFMQGVGSSETANTMLRAIIELAHSLNVRPLAEGVESEEQCRFLSSVQCHLAQGNLFGGPVAASQVVWPTASAVPAETGSSA